MTKKILFIDDELTTLKVGCLMLKALGYDVVDVQSGYAGLELLKSEKFDLVLLDLMMPEIYGLDLLRKIKDDEDLKTLPVIIQTGVVDQDDIKDAYAIGANAVINKPYNRDILKEALNRILCMAC